MSKIFQRICGWTIIIVLLSVLFCYAASIAGVVATAKVFGFIIGTTLLMIIAIHLIVESHLK